MQAPLIEKFIVVGLDTTKESKQKISFYQCEMCVFNFLDVKALRLNDVLENRLLPSFLDIFPFESLDSPSYIDNFKLVKSFVDCFISFSDFGGFSMKHISKFIIEKRSRIE